MKCTVADMLKLRFQPVAILWSNEKPEKALQFVPGRRGCLMSLFAQAALGKTAVIDRETFGCYGGGVGAGFGNQFEHSPGGMERFRYFLSNGILSCKSPDAFDEIVEKTTSPEQKEHLRHGERYRKTPELVDAFVKNLPITDIPVTYVILKPLSALSRDEIPRVVVFCGNPHQVSALVTLVHYRRPGVDSVIVPASAGCHQIMLFPYREAEGEDQRAVLGLTDPSARKEVMRVLGDDAMTFAVPWKMFREMEDDAPVSFLCGNTWGAISKRL
jgi:uncharacterized protein (DUF169 family)